MSPCQIKPEPSEHHGENGEGVIIVALPRSGNMTSLN
jgi:hypothetical protein